MKIFTILSSSTGILFVFLPVFSVFLLSWLTSLPKKSINTLNPIWHFCLIIQNIIYLKQSGSYAVYKLILFTLFISERLAYMSIFYKYSNINEHLQYFEKYSSLITGVVPYSILNFLNDEDSSS